MSAFMELVLQEGETILFNYLSIVLEGGESFLL